MMGIRNRARWALPAAALVLLSGVASAGEFGVPPGDPTTDPATGYFLLVGRDTGNVAAGDDVAPFFGDPTMTGCTADPVPGPGVPGDPCGQMFYIEVYGTPARLQVDLYDPGLLEPDPGQQVGPQLDLSYDTGDGTTGIMHYDLYDPAGNVQASQMYTADTQGPAGTNMGLVSLYSSNNATDGIWILHAWLEDTGGRDEEINVFGVSVPNYRVYTYYPVIGHAAAAGAIVDSAIFLGGEPMRLYPWIHGASHGLEKTSPSDPGIPVFGMAIFNFDMDAAPTIDPNDNPSLGEPPPEITGITAQGAVSPPCSQDPNFCFFPSVDTAYVRERRAGFNVSNLDGTDHGLYTWEISGVDSSWGITEMQAPPATLNDVNAFALQMQEYMAPVPALDSTDFPHVPADGLPLWRWYLPMDGVAQPPTKEWMGIQAMGPDGPFIGVAEVYTIQWEVHNPTDYDITDFQTAVHVNDTTADVSPPVGGSLASTGPLLSFLDDDPGSTCPNTLGTDPKRVVVCGDLGAGESATVEFDVTVTASSTDTLYLLGDGDPTDGIAMTGGARPTIATYLTPFTTDTRELMGPLLAPHVFPIEPPCTIDVTIDPPGGEPYCSFAFDTLTSQATVTSCTGVIQYRWSTTGGDICIDWTDNADTLVLPMGACPLPAADTTYLVEARCSDEPSCTDSDQRLVTFHPQVFADAGPPSVAICPGEDVALGVDDPVGQGLQTGQVAGKDSCTELTYAWDPPAGLSNGNGSCGACADPATCWYPIAAPGSDTTYTVTVTDPATGCSAQDSIDVNVGSDAPPSHLGCSLRVSREGTANIRFNWTDAPEAAGEYQVVALEPDGGDTPPCANLLPATMPPDLTAMDNAQVVATAAPGAQTAVYADGQVTCPRLLFFKARATSPCSNTPTPFPPATCN